MFVPPFAVGTLLGVAVPAGAPLTGVVCSGVSPRGGSATVVVSGTAAAAGGAVGTVYQRPLTSFETWMRGSTWAGGATSVEVCVCCPSRGAVVSAADGGTAVVTRPSGHSHDALPMPPPPSGGPGGGGRMER